MSPTSNPDGTPIDLDDLVRRVKERHTAWMTLDQAIEILGCVLATPMHDVQLRLDANRRHITRARSVLIELKTELDAAEEMELHPPQE